MMDVPFPVGMYLTLVYVEGITAQIVIWEICFYNVPSGQTGQPILVNQTTNNDLFNSTFCTLFRLDLIARNRYPLSNMLTIIHP